MTKVKVCGMRRPEDLEAAAGADYLGFVVESDSPRALPLREARELMSVCDRNKVAVTTLEGIHDLARIARELEPDVLQAHAPLTPSDIAQLTDECRCEVWALVPMGDGGEMHRATELSRVADAIILDTRSERLGGSGRSHDWDLSGEISNSLRPFPVVLAGGLTPINVRDAIVKAHPFAVDVSSGVEVDGRKDADLVRRFIDGARRAAE